MSYLRFSSLRDRLMQAGIKYIYCDMDGVLADFDAHHEKVFGWRPNRTDREVNWGDVREVRNFYRDIPPMADMRELWEALEPWNEYLTILTGIPDNVPEAADNKRFWVLKNLGAGWRVICCRSREKFLHSQPGSILIDDYIKYRDLWVQEGGLWITHTSAAQTIADLEKLARG